MTKRAFLLFVTAMLTAAATFGQDSITVTFSHQTTDGGFLQPDSIVIENLTRNWSETIYYPDTVYTFVIHTSVPNRIIDNGIQVLPNPFDGTTRVNITSPKDEQVLLRITDIHGHVCVEHQGRLQVGDNVFTISLTTPQTYVLSAQSPSGTRSSKISNTGHAGANSIRCEGVTGDALPAVKSRSISSYEFEPGDKMRYRAYSPTIVSSSIIHNQFISENIIFVFDTHGTPCEGQPLLHDYDGNIYNTVQIGSQCWMKENLRTSKYPDGTDIPVGGSVSVADTAPYYCDYIDYYNIEIPWEERGNFYNWHAALGACPSGWHLPSDSELTVLKDYVSSQTEYICDNMYNYIYIGKALASTSWWTVCSSGGCSICSDTHTNNLTGFSAIPAGFCYGSTSFGQEREVAYLWSSTESDASEAYHYVLFSQNAYFFRATTDKNFGRSVRCLRD